MKSLAFLTALTLSAAALGAASAQTPSAGPWPIATIDFYGQRTLDLDTLRKALPFHEGDKVSPGASERLTPQARAALSALPHIKDARVYVVCCTRDGGVNVFVGVQEDSSPQQHFRPAPTGDVRLPADLVAHAQAVAQAVQNAVLKGAAAEDDSEGHALLTEDADARRLQEQMVPLAARNLEVLRRVLHDSADARQRAIAAQFLGYGPDMQAMVSDLVQAMDDPDEGVRNNAVRALLVFSKAKSNPPRIPYEPFVALLESESWFDLNKGSFALASLSETRNPELLALLRRRSLPALAAMVRWRDAGHVYPAYVILGRIGGLSDHAIDTAFAMRDADSLIAAAQRAAGIRRRYLRLAGERAATWLAPVAAIDEPEPRL